MRDAVCGKLPGKALHIGDGRGLDSCEIPLALQALRFEDTSTYSIERPEIAKVQMIGVGLRPDMNAQSSGA